MKGWWFAVAGIFGAGAALLFLASPDVNDNAISYEVTRDSPKEGPTSSVGEPAENSVASAIDLSRAHKKSTSQEASSSKGEADFVEAKPEPRMNPLAKKSLERRNTPQGRAASGLSVPWIEIRRQLLLSGENPELVKSITELDTLLIGFYRSPRDYDWAEVEQANAELYEKVQTEYAGRSEFDEAFSMIDGHLQTFKEELEAAP